MNKNFTTTLCLAASLLVTSGISPSDNCSTAIASNVIRIAAASPLHLDETVKQYLKAVRRAKSVSDLRAYLPTFRMKKFETEYSPKQKADWLRYRKQMPRIGSLISQDVRKDRAIMIYETVEKSHARSEQRTIVEITLVKEREGWKILLEHFGPLKKDVKQLH